jgi:hypothetical protein
VRSDYDVTYGDHGTALVFRADLDAGWGQLKKTYGFFRMLWVWYKDWHIRTQLALIAQPATYDERAATFPDVSIETKEGAVLFSVQQKILTVKVPLIVDLPWRMTPTKCPEIFIEKLPLLAAKGLLFDLRIWIVFHPPHPAPIPDVRVWCQKMFVPGGQMESNRRRH